MLSGMTLGRKALPTRWVICPVAIGVGDGSNFGSSIITNPGAVPLIDEPKPASDVCSQSEIVDGFLAPQTIAGVVIAVSVYRFYVVRRVAQGGLPLIGMTPDCRVVGMRPLSP